MKHWFLVVCLSLLSVVYFAGRNSCPPVVAGTEDSSTEAFLKTDNDNAENLWAFVQANSVADLSIQQTNPFHGNNNLRRYPQERSFQSKVFFCLAEKELFISSHLFKTISYRFREYIAHQRHAGYYIYTLCKIVI